MGWKLPKIKIKNLSVPDLIAVAKKSQEVALALKIVGGILAFDESEDPIDPYVEIYHLYEQACSKLEERTTISEDVPTSSLDDQSTSAGTLLGCWFDPTSKTDQFAINQRLYKDLASFLTISGVPAKLEYKEKGKYEDIASLIAEVAFPELPDQSDANDTIVKDTFITIPNLDKTCIIQVKNACYRIPLGDSVATTAWHAGLQVRTTMSKEFREAQLRKLPEKRTALAPTDSADWQWISNVRVDWADSSTAEDAHQDIPGRFLKQNPKYLVTLISVIGITLTLQIAAPRGIKPAAIEIKFSEAVTDFVKAKKGNLLVMPTVNLVSSTLV